VQSNMQCRSNQRMGSGVQIVSREYRIRVIIIERQIVSVNSTSSYGDGHCPDHVCLLVLVRHGKVSLFTARSE
jgi:Holliday junction resolvasome RuvABC endonuclease subunit